MRQTQSAVVAHSDADKMVDLLDSSYTSTSTLTDKGVFFELTPEFRQQHYLVGLVLSDLSNAFDAR